jgi:hypothetical protein
VSKYKNGMGAAALVGVLALAGAACGSSSKTASTPTTTVAPATTPAATTDTVTAIPHLTGVGTTVTLNTATMAALTSLGVKVTTTGTAKLAGSAVTFPITSGYVEIHSNHSFKPGYIVGSIEHYGSGLTFSAGGKSLAVSDFVVDPGNSMLYASVGVTPDVPLLSLDGAAVKVSMSGADVVLNGTVAKLTPAAAGALDKTFGTTAVKAGLPLGTVHLVASGTANTYTGAATEVSRLTGTSTSVALDPATVAALTSLKVKLAPEGTATVTGGEIHFPITGGFAVIHKDLGYKPGYISGVLIHQGSGFTLTAGTTTVTLSDFVVDPGNSTLTGTVNGTEIGVPLLSLNGSAVKITPVGTTVHIDGTVASLTAVAASALNKAFGTTALKAGIELGVVHIIAS